MAAPTSPAPARLNPRAAALAAAEARLRPTPSAADTDTASASASASSPANPASNSSIPPSGPLLSGASSPRSEHGTSTPTLRADSSPGGLFNGARGPAGRTGTRSPPVSAWAPTEKGDRETRKEFARLLDRGIVRDNGYRDAAAAVETLLTIANNVISQSDPKYRDLKASNSTLKNKVLAVKGGHEYLIRLGFRTSTIDFTQHFIFQPSVRRMHELKIGKEVLAEHIDNLQARANLTATSRTLASADEAERRAKALREIEDDRDQVRDRVNRERRMRDREERLARERAEQAAWSAAQGDDQGGAGSGIQPEWYGGHGHDDDDEDDDEMGQEDEMVLQGGRRLDS